MADSLSITFIAIQPKRFPKTKCYELEKGCNYILANIRIQAEQWFKAKIWAKKLESMHSEISRAIRIEKQALNTPDLIDIESLWANCWHRNAEKL
jgi:hypothetical protein